MLAGDRKAWKLYRNLVWIAQKRYGCDRDAALEYASFGICKALEYDTMTLNYAARCMTNEIRLRRRLAKRECELTYDDNGDAVEYMMCTTPATQEIGMMASQCVRAISILPPSVGRVFPMVAMEHTPLEIANILRIKESTTERAIAEGRRILRERDLYDLPQKRGHQQFIGIKRSHRKWKAYVNKDGHRHYVGTFETAAQAAKAYDEKATELLGDLAKLNFPSGRGRTMIDKSLLRAPLS